MPRITVPAAPLFSSARTQQGLLSIGDLDPATFWRLVDRAAELGNDLGAHDEPLRGGIFGLLFTRTSTRTRTAFTVGAERLGGRTVSFGPQDLQTNTGETLADTGRILSLMLDGLVVRSPIPVSDLRDISRSNGLPVINAMVIEEHPTQAVCDIATLRHAAGGGDLDGLRLLYVGEANNTVTALVQATAMIPGSVTVLATPPGYGLSEWCRRAVADRSATTGASLAEVHSLADVEGDFDVLYTTRWQTTGTNKPDPDWREAFRPFYVDSALLDRWPRAVFMHDLPAHRGEDVAGAVLDGPRSLSWSQVRMKLLSSMAVLEYAFGGSRSQPPA